MALYNHNPIVDSVLDDDAYKLFMGQAIWRYRPDVPVTLGFINRTVRVLLARYVSATCLREQLEHVRTLKLQHEEAEFLRRGANVRSGLFDSRYIDFLANRELPSIEVVETPDGQFDIQSSGPWSTVSYWEIPVMKIVNTLYFQAKREEEGVSEEDVWQRGETRLREKLRMLKEKNIRFVDFGNRRCYHPLWHHRVLEITMNEAPELLAGISNVRLAMVFGKKASGTIAHEFYMVFANLFGNLPEQIRGSFQEVLKLWWDMYGAELAIVLTDTFGSEFCFQSITDEWARLYLRLRHDSGDPFAFGERAIEFYSSKGIDPKTATVVFSDGLTAELICELHNRFVNRIGVGYGWGTTYTNDVGFKTLSIVMKVLKANGLWAVKLSDNPAKALGPSGRVAYMKYVHGYREGDRVECIV